MDVGVDSYSYHRFFGEIRPGERDPGTRWTQWDFLEEAAALGVDWVSLETCYLPNDDSVWDEVARRVAEAGLSIAVAWGHPRGLRMGLDAHAVGDMAAMLDRAIGLGSPLLRIVAGGPADFGVEPEGTVVGRVAPVLREFCSRAIDAGVTVAVETHADLTLEGLEDLLDAVPALGVVLDTANVPRVGGDLLDASRRLAERTVMVHCKDLDLEAADQGDPGGWWPCRPLGDGGLPLVGCLQALSAAGFEGPVCVEVATIPDDLDEREVVRDGVRWLRYTIGTLRPD